MLPQFNNNRQLQTSVLNPPPRQQEMGMQMPPQMAITNDNNNYNGTTHMALNNPRAHFVSSQFFNFQPANPSYIPHNQNFNFQGGGMLNPMNLNQFLPIQMPGFIAQLGVGPQNVAFGTNTQLGWMQVGGGIVQQQLPINGNLLSAQLPNVGLGQNQPQQNLPQQPQGNLQQQPLHNRNNFQHPHSAKSQGNSGNPTGSCKVRYNLKHSPKKIFARNTNHNASSNAYVKFQSRTQIKGKSKFHTQHGGKGHNYDGATSLVDSAERMQSEKKKRSLCLNYTEEEVRVWREERRKNYPSKANMEKLTEQSMEPDNIIKMRRQQLKEILAKQAELGCEVAEVAPCYLSDSEQQAHGRENSKGFSRKDKFHNFGERRKFHQTNRFTRKQRSTCHDISNMPDLDDHSNKKQRLANDGLAKRCPVGRKREPTLLQRLLSSDVRRDKHYLLQVFRFMAMNSFFKDWPEKPLTFPTVLVRESGAEFIEDKSTSDGISEPAEI